MNPALRHRRLLAVVLRGGALWMLAAAAVAAAQEQPRDKPLVPPGPPPTAAGDTTAGAAPDSLVRYVLLREPAFLELNQDSSGGFSATDLEWLAPQSVGTAFHATAGVFLADPASVGQYLRPFVRGADWRGTTVLLDGVPLNDPLTGVMNLSFIPLEIVGQMEIVSSPRTFLYGRGSPAGAVNMITKQAENVIPATKVRYSESSYGYGFSDGSFNQKISRRWSVGLGYQFQGIDGRFRNSAHEQWNIRGSLRYALAPRWNITYSHLYTQTQTALNEGIDLSASGTAQAFVPQRALARNPDAYEKITRHDAALSLNGNLFSDTADVTSVTAYASHLLREYRDEEQVSFTNLLAVQPTNGIFLKHDHRLAWYGLQVRQRFAAGPVTLTGGMRLEEQQVYGSPAVGRHRHPGFTAWARGVLEPAPWLTLAGSVRSETSRGETLPGIGIEGVLRPAPGLTMGAAYAVSRRALSLTERDWTDTTLVRDGALAAERHQLAELFLAWRNADGRSHVRLAGWRRIIENPVALETLSEPAATGSRTTYRVFHDTRTTIDGIDLDAKIRFGFIETGGTGMLIMRAAGGMHSAWKEIPRATAQGFLYFRDRIIGGALDLQAGVRARFRSSFEGSTLLGEHLLSVPNRRTTLGMASSLDLVLVGRIGNAYVHFLWENVTDTQYFSTPFTPAQDRTIRFGISWTFLN